MYKVVAKRYVRKYGKTSGAKRAWGIASRCKSYTRTAFWERVANTIQGYRK